ncbi:hypothetical protein BHM03_00014885 [Ensete ventricosum]|uniref:Uncharacterized protein n=1 Tax=Ensete ventricosum TaxID=4639 RepID=A0A445MEH5_ENSVE|nr:hypothetical protein BHM03_00014885 [Ensete ventricosum]
MTEVAMEATVASAVAFLGLNPHWVGGFEESFLPDLEEDLSLDKVEWSVGELGNDLLYSFRPLPWELGWWAPRGFDPRSLLVFPLLCHQGLGGDILVGPLQHFRHSRWVSLHKRPKEAGRSDPDHECLDDQRRMRIKNGPDLFRETSEVQAEGLIFLLPYTKEGRSGRLRPGAMKEVGLELFRELVERVDQGGRCALKESVESKERVSGSGVLGAEVLGVDVVRLTASLGGVWLGSTLSRGCSSGGCVTRGWLSSGGVVPVGTRGASRGRELGGWASYGM